MPKFDIVSIPGDARLDTEQLGSKPKFWALLNGQRWLFKEARPGTGEDWAEKAAAEIARTLGLNAATVELAEYEGRPGCISLNFIDVAAGEALVHGNEVLAWSLTGYDKAKTFRQSDHTLENVRGAIRALFTAGIADSMLTELASYLVFDALIGNTDRHHENWGLKLQRIATPRSPKLTVAPSYDHASSLGRELQDTRRAALLKSNGMLAYLAKARGGIFKDADQPHGANPLRVVQDAAQAYPAHFAPALKRAAELDPDVIHDVLASIPPQRASEQAKAFAETLVLTARQSLIELLK